MRAGMALAWNWVLEPELGEQGVQVGSWIKRASIEDGFHSVDYHRSKCIEDNGVNIPHRGTRLLQYEKGKN